MFLFYPVIITLGIVSTYSDIRFKIIKNSHLVLAFISGVLIHVYLILRNEAFFSPHLLINFLIGFSLAFVLFWTRTWGPGDAKLFIVFCLLMPRNKYSQLIPYPAIVVFANIFLLSTIFIIILSTYKAVINRKPAFKKIFNTQSFVELGDSFISVFALGWLISPLVNLFKNMITPFIYVLILFFSYVLLRQLINVFKKKSLNFLVLGLGIVSRIIFQPSDFGFSSLQSYLKTTFFYSLLFYFIINVYSLNKNRDEKKFDNLIPFAPLIFLGTLIADTNFMYWVMHILNIIKK